MKKYLDRILKNLEGKYFEKMEEFKKKELEIWKKEKEDLEKDLKVSNKFELIAFLKFKHDLISKNNMEILNLMDEKLKEILTRNKFFKEKFFFFGPKLFVLSKDLGLNCSFSNVLKDYEIAWIEGDILKKKNLRETFYE